MRATLRGRPNGRRSSCSGPIDASSAFVNRNAPSPISMTCWWTRRRASPRTGSRDDTTKCALSGAPPQEIAQQSSARRLRRYVVHVVENDARRNRCVLGERTAQRAQRRIGVGRSEVDRECECQSPAEVRGPRVGRTARDRDVDTTRARDIVGNGLAQQRRLPEPRTGDERDGTHVEASPHEFEEARPAPSTADPPRPGTTTGRRYSSHDHRHAELRWHDGPGRNDAGSVDGRDARRHGDHCPRGDAGGTLHREERPATVPRSGDRRRRSRVRHLRPHETQPVPAGRDRVPPRGAPRRDDDVRARRA